MPHSPIITCSGMLLLYYTQIPPRMLDPLSSLQPLSTVAFLFVTEAFAAVTHAAEHVELVRKEMSATPWTVVAILRTVYPSARAVHAAKMDAAVLVELVQETMMLDCFAWECRLPLRMDPFHRLAVKVFQSAITSTRRAQAAPTSRFVRLTACAMIPSRTWLTWSSLKKT
jgi:hypothetical protein